MTQPTPTPQTQPRDRRALSHLTHGLTGARIYLFGEAEQQAYDDLCRDLTASLAPVGETELQLAKQICDDRWRLQRAASFESAIFADRAAQFAADAEQSTGDPAVDAAISHGETWLAEAKNLNLLTLYENRIHRRWERNLKELQRLEAERKAALESAIEEAALLSQLAALKGQTYNLAESFALRNFEFSGLEMERMVSRFLRLKEAQKLCITPKKAVRIAA